jgi:SWIM zinc finger
MLILDQDKYEPNVLIPLMPCLGLYVHTSSKGDRIYDVDVLDRTCNCKAGQYGFQNCHAGACKHLLNALDHYSTWKED